MQALIVQHEPDGPAGLLGEHLTARGYDLRVLQVMRDGSTESDVAFPSADGFDVVAVLGSKHSVYDRDAVGTWIDRELAMLAGAQRDGVPVLGICFGAQALTAALGGRVEAAPVHEIGWWDIDADGEAAAVGAGPWFTWHGDRCILPDGIDELARSEVCTQAFRHGRSLGVQFHPEVDEPLARAWVDSCAPDYFERRGVDPAAVLEGFRAHGADAERRATELFDWFLDEVAR